MRQSPSHSSRDSVAGRSLQAPRPLREEPARGRPCPANTALTHAGARHSIAAIVIACDLTPEGTWVPGNQDIVPAASGACHQPPITGLGSAAALGRAATGEASCGDL